MNLKIEVGHYYLNANGEIVKIIDGHDSIHFLIKDFYYYDISDNSYFENGKCSGDCREFDLIAEIPKELNQYLIQTIKDYHTDLDFKNSVNSVYGAK